MSTEEKIALGVFAFVAGCLIVRSQKPSIGRVSKKRRQVINDAYRGLNHHFGNRYRKAREKQAKDIANDSDYPSRYFTIYDGNRQVNIRNADHEGYNGKKLYAERHVYDVDLYNLARKKETAKDIYDEAKRSIDYYLSSYRK